MLEAPAVFASVTDLVAGATERTAMTEGAGKSGARLERVVIGGQPYVLKHLDLAQDWTMRASGCLRGAPLLAWERGLLARLPACFNQPIVGVAPEDGDGPAPSGGCALLMRDVSPWLVPVTDEPISLDQHLRFLRHMAALHAAFWGCGSECEVVPVMHRYLELSPWLAYAEAAVGSAHLVPRLVGEGWPRLAEVAPAAAAVVTPLARDPGPLVEALEGTPQTFVHSNWKLDNLGTDDDGRTIVLDWEQPGRGAPLSDLAWYLAINCRRLPQGKQDAIAAYRRALEEHGIARAAAARGRAHLPVVDLAAGPGAHEASQLLLPGPVALRGLAAEGAERPELALPGDEPLDRGGAEGADQLVFQVGDAHVEAEPFGVVAGQHGAEARAGQAAPEVSLLPLVAQAGQPGAQPARAEQVEKVPDVRGAAHRHHEDAFLPQVPAAARGQRLDGGLVAHPLDQDDRARPGRRAPHRGHRRGQRNIAAARRAGDRDQAGQRLVVHYP